MRLTEEDLVFPPGSYLEYQDKLDHQGAAIYNNIAQDEFSSGFKWFMDLVGVSQLDLCASATLVKNKLIGDGVFTPDEHIGGVGSQNTLSKCLSGQQHPGQQMLDVWMTTIKYYFVNPLVIAEVTQARNKPLPGWEELREREEKLYIASGNAVPESIHQSAEWLHYDSQARPDVRYLKAQELRFARFTGPLPTVRPPVDTQGYSSTSLREPITDKFRRPSSTEPTTDPESNIIAWRPNKEQKQY